MTSQIAGQLVADTAAVVWLVVVIALAVAVIAFFVAAVVSIVSHPRLTLGGRALWLLIVLVAQFVGPCVWFAWGRHARGNSLYLD